MWLLYILAISANDGTVVYPDLGVEPAVRPTETACMIAGATLAAAMEAEIDGVAARFICVDAAGLRGK